jgi:hypothetical protein
MTTALIATLLGLGVGLGLGGAPNTKDAAAPRCTFSLDAGAREDRALGGDSLRAALAEASGCTVGSERRAPTVLRVRVVGGRARLELRVHGRETLVRIVALDADPHERTQAIVIVATHMLRNEADELLGLLGRRGGGASEATPLAETQPPASTSDAATATRDPADTEASADVIATEPTTSVIASDATNVIASEATTNVIAAEANETRVDVIASESTVDVIATEATTVVTATEGGTPVEGAQERGPPIVRLGLTGLVSSVPSGVGVEATVIAGLEITATPTPWLALGVRDLLGGVSPGAAPSWAFGGGAFAELSLRVIEWLALEGQLGADVRAISIADRGRAGVAPFVVVGARAFLAPELSISLQSGLHVVATDVWASAVHLVPRGAVVWSGGLAFGVHL